MEYLNYSQWKDTADTLHMLLQITGKIKMQCCHKRPEWAHVRQYLTIDGLTSGILPGGECPYQISINLRSHYLELCNAAGKCMRIPLRNSTTVADYYTEVMNGLGYIGSPTTINVRPQEFWEDIAFDKDTKHHSYDENAVLAFLENLLFAHHAMNKFLSPFRGKVNYPAYYFGTMDLSGIVYSGEPAPFHNDSAISSHAFDERYCEIGFWPGDIYADKPSFYVLPYPFISDIKGNEHMIVPPKAVFTPEKKEFFLTLEDALSYNNPTETVVDFFKSSFKILQQVERWDHIDWITEPLSYET